MPESNKLAELQSLVYDTQTLVGFVDIGARKATEDCKQGKLERCEMNLDMARSHIQSLRGCMQEMLKDIDEISAHTGLPVESDH